MADPAPRGAGGVRPWDDGAQVVRPGALEEGHRDEAARAGGHIKVGAVPYEVPRLSVSTTCKDGEQEPGGDEAGQYLEAGRMGALMAPELQS